MLGSLGLSFIAKRLMFLPEQVARAKGKSLCESVWVCGKLRCQTYIGIDIEYIPKDVLSFDLS